MNTVSGDVQIRTAMNGLAVNSVSGDAVLGEVYGDLNAGTVSGDLMVRAAGPGDVGLKAVSGDVVVAMRRGLRLRLDVNSVSGSVGSELDVSDAPDPQRRPGGDAARPYRQRRRADHPRSGSSRLVRKPGGLWRHRDFLSLWGAETISQFGSQVTFLALPLVAILVLEESAFNVAALTSLEFLPFLLFTLPAGVWVDRLRRKPILVLGDVGRAVALLVGAARALDRIADDLAALRRRLRPSASARSSSTSPTSRTSRLSSGGSDVVEANAKLEISRAAANIGGPGMAGGLVAALTAPVAVLVDAVSFALSALLLLRGSASRRRRRARDGAALAPARAGRGPALRLHALVPARRWSR